MRYYVQIFFLFLSSPSFGKINQDKIDSFTIGTDVKITIDAPALKHSNKVILIVYALPNGNTTVETMGKKMKEGDDWHFNI